jgi:hypothetical protein
MMHPDDRKLALFACGDAGWVERIVMGRHLRTCESCRRRADTFRRDRLAVSDAAAELPEGLDWNRLAAEMTANIHLGLEAGECVSDLRPARSHAVAWRPAFAAAGLAAIVLGGAYLNFPEAQKASLARGISRIWNQPAPTAEQGVALAATRNGIEVRENGAALTMVNPGQAPTAVVVNTSGSLRARYVDDDTGQVTITNVYAQ